MAQEVVFDDKRVREFIEKTMKNVKEVGSAGRTYASLLAALVFPDIVSHFENESGPSGGWKPWSKIYAEHMKKIGKGGNKILQDTGRLRQNFKPTSYRPTSGKITWYNDAKTKSGFPYAAHHDESREFMWLSESGLEKMSEQTLKFVLENG